MNRRDPDELLWELSDLENSSVDNSSVQESLSREVLEAWRAGKLRGAEAAHVESALAHQPAARERLHHMARVESPGPPAALRTRVLESVASVTSGGRSGRPSSARSTLRSPRRSTLRPLRRSTLRSLRGWFPQVAALAASCVFALGWYLHVAGSGARPADLPIGMEFNVGFEMLAEVRSNSAEGSTNSAYAETRVRIVVESGGEAIAGLEFGLYRNRGEVLERLSTGSGIRLETGRGTALFEAPAWRLVGAEAGSKELLVAVARTGRLPKFLEVAVGREAAAVLAEHVGGRVYRHTILVLPNRGATEEKTRRGRKRLDE